MNKIIREKRKLTFNEKRINPKTIREFASIIQKEVSSLKEEYFLNYSVDATDDTSYESQSEEIFSENEIMEKKVLQKIGMRFNTLSNSKNIEMQITHSIAVNTANNFILVSGDDPNWVSGILGRLRETIDLAEEQPKYSKGFGWMNFGILILFNVVYFRYFLGT